MNNTLRTELLDMCAADQAAAVAAFHASEKDVRFRGKFLFQIPKAEWVPEFHRADEVAARNANRMREIVEKTGWPGRSIVGEDGAEAAWLIVQHGGERLQRACLPLIARAVSEGEAEPQHLAAVADRAELEKGKPQIYGTHLVIEEGRHVPLFGVIDPAQLDERSEKLGLGKWSDYVASLKEC